MNALHFVPGAELTHPKDFARIISRMNIIVDICLSEKVACVLRYMHTNTDQFRENHNIARSTDFLCYAEKAGQIINFDLL